jgi:hypothetical protein
MAGGDGSFVGAAHANSTKLITKNVMRVSQRAIILFIETFLGLSSDFRVYIIDGAPGGNHIFDSFAIR